VRPVIAPSSFAVRRRLRRSPSAVCAFVGRASPRESRADPVTRIAGGFTRGPGPSTRIAGGLHVHAWTSAVARVAPSSADPTRRARPVSFTRTRRSRSSRAEPGRDARSSTRDTPLHARIRSQGDFFRATSSVFVAVFVELSCLLKNGVLLSLR
jgi:hypothetical protein